MVRDPAALRAAFCGFEALALVQAFLCGGRGAYGS